MAEKIDLLLAKLYEYPSTSLLVLLVEHVVQNRVKMLGVLDENRIAESERAL